MLQSADTDGEQIDAHCVCDAVQLGAHKLMRPTRLMRAVMASCLVGGYIVFFVWFVPYQIRQHRIAPNHTVLPAGAAPGWSWGLPMKSRRGR
jgi:hypothetical protein